MRTLGPRHERRRREGRRDLDPSPVRGDRCGRRLEDVDDVGGLLGAGPVRAAVADRVGHLGDPARPGGAAKRRPNRWHERVLPAVGADLDRRVEVLEAAQVE